MLALATSLQEMATGHSGKQSKHPQWKFEFSASDRATKVVNGKTYHKCPHHGTAGMWVLHKPETYENKARREGSATSSEQATSQSASSKQLELSDLLKAALMTTVNDEEADSAFHSSYYDYNNGNES